MTLAPRLRLVGPGRAGGAFSIALDRAGWEILDPVRGGGDPSDAGDGADLVLVTTPDGVIAEVAARIAPSGAVVAHTSGSLGLDVLAGHRRVAAVHPLVSLPNAELGAQRLTGGAWFAVAGDPLVQRVVEDLGGRWFELADAHRAAYHAAAAVASNHLVALLGQVERIAVDLGVPPEAYLDLARASLENVAELGASAALTGPVARGDWPTVARHLAALDRSEHDAYRALAAAARRLVDGGGLPAGL